MLRSKRKRKVKKKVLVYAEASPLVQAIIAKQPISEILDLISYEPVAAQFRNANGRYPLHEACQHIRGDNGNVIMKLLEVFPQAAQFQDEEGWYPLHLVCRHCQCADVILKLIEIHPEAAALQLPGSSRRYPLHESCRHFSDDQRNIIMKLLEVFPQAAQFQDAEGYYPLHIACYRHHEHDDVIQKLIEVHPEAVAKAALLRSGRMYALQLLNASYYNYEHVVSTLAHIYPAALHCKYQCWRYPVHRALGLERGLEIIKTFINLAPSVIHQKDGGGATLLHLACSRHRTVENVVEYYLELPDLDVNATNKDGNSALHMAIESESFDIVDALLRHPLIIIDQRNQDFGTPGDIVESKIDALEIPNPYHDYYYVDDDGRKSLLAKFQQVKRQLKDHFLINRWGSYKYFYQNVKDWSVNL